MNVLSMRAGCALALALALAGCGGKAEFPVTVSVSGLFYPGLVVSNNGQNMSVAVPPANQFGSASVDFPNTISYGDAYQVTIGSDPQHSHCQLADAENNAKGTAGRLASINVVVNCTVDAHSLGGSVTGLTSTGLTIINGSSGGGANAVPGTTTSADFTISSLVQYGVPYGLSILSQPLYDTCKIDSGAIGTMGDFDIKNVAVSCVRDTVAGGITGLSSAGLVITNASTGATFSAVADANGVFPAVFSFGRTGAGSAYNLQVSSQPANQNCTIANGTGTVSSSAAAIVVSCVAK
jgi:hypothetical protein